MTNVAEPWIAALIMTAIGLLVLVFYSQFSSRHFSYPVHFSELCKRAGLASAMSGLPISARNVAVTLCNQCARKEACGKWLEGGIEERGYRRFCPNAGLVDWLAEWWAIQKAVPDLCVTPGPLSHPSTDLPPIG